ncbi:STAS domain-containing protein [Actinomadura latina]|uniref:Anti-sigma factor antagonist n=1 Tax=Actinomadura latina TaxID=163603 RepID=A0A846ZAR0_9ACTN|nr:STAS domain-containing protein [Actinomadura latina]NKZ08262.1 STAS domain-containing protein [Actinomadura latina]
MTHNNLTVDLSSQDAEVPVLHVAGDLDHHTAPLLREALDAVPFSPGKSVVVDLTGLAYCDSTGITVLINAYKRAKPAGGRLLLAGLSPDLLDVFRIIGLDQIFVFHPTVDEAIAAARRA